MSPSPSISLTEPKVGLLLTPTSSEPGPPMISVLGPALSDATFQPVPVPINNCPLVGIAVVPVPPTARENTPDVIFSAEMLGISSATSERNVGGASEPSAGPANTLPASCSLRVAARVPNEVTGDPSTLKTPSKLRPTDVTAPPTS